MSHIFVEEEIPAYAEEQTQSLPPKIKKPLTTKQISDITEKLERHPLLNE
jgi:hypothetical protein